jgi:hypothetical protein
MRQITGNKELKEGPKNITAFISLFAPSFMTCLMWRVTIEAAIIFCKILISYQFHKFYT